MLVYFDLGLSTVLIATRFILIETSHAGNVGACARAMKVMDFEDLVLVRPRYANVLRREETIQRASGALQVLSNARVVETLDEALEGMTHLCATVMTARDFGPPTLPPREYLQQLAQSLRPTPGPTSGPAPDQNSAINGNQSALASHGAHGVAFLFGSERFGMSNDDVYRAHVALQIPTNPHFGSLNLASALQLLAYEWRLSLGGFGALPAQTLSLEGDSVNADSNGAALADSMQIGGLLKHWQEALEAIGFLDPLAPKKLMPRLNQLFNRARMVPEEVHIFRGIAKAMLEASARSKDRLISTQKTSVPSMHPKNDRL